MKVSGAALALLCCLAAEAAPRDPFQAPVERCPQVQWDKWRYHGMVGGGAAIKAIIETPEGKWLRVSRGQWLTAALQVQTVAVDEIVIATPPACGEGQLHWRLKEKFHDMDVQIHRAVAPVNRPGRRAGQ